MGSSQTRARTRVPCIGRQILNHCATREALESFYHKWVLNFVKSFFCIYSDDHMVFILQFVNMVYYIDWFAYIEESLHPWDKSHLIVVYDPFNVLLDSVC